MHLIDRGNMVSKILSGIEYIIDKDSWIKIKAAEMLNIMYSSSNDYHTLEGT